MKSWEAETLASVIAQSWPAGSITPDIWAEELAELDHRQADATIRDMRRKTHRAPSVADFRAHYLARTAPTPHDDRCELCGGWGWVTDDPGNHPEHWPGRDTMRPPENGDDRHEPNGWQRQWTVPPVNVNDFGSCNCNVVVPCRCSIGRHINKARLGREVTP